MATPVLETKTNTKTNQTTYSIDGKPVDQKLFDATYQKFYAEPPAPGYTNTGPAVRRTPETDPRSSQYIPPIARDKPRNILHNFRSFTYNFTLATLPKDQVNTKFTSVSQLTNVILTTKGKGLPTAPTAPPKAAVPDAAITSLRNAGKTEAEINKFKEDFAQFAANHAKEESGNTLTNEALIAYNNSSAGRFDMFIDDIEIVSVIGHNENTGTSTGYEFNFTVVEPYSIFGFMEALLKNAIETGYKSYIDCLYVLALDFSGYPDLLDLPTPINIPESTRFFGIKFYEVNISISERGAIYTCKAFAAADIAFSETHGKVKSEILATGTTVKEQLTNFMQELTRRSKEEATGRQSTVWNTYKIEFPLLDGTGENTRIANAKFKGEGTEKITIPSGQAITKAIDDIITKSEYGESIVIPDGKGIDKTTNLAYTWQTSSKIEFGGSNNRDADSLSNATTITFKVTEFKTNAAAIAPSQATLNSNYDVLSDRSNRRYDYLFTGKNTDILDFKVDFNLAFFAGSSSSANDSPSRQSTGKDDSSNPATNPTDQTPTSTRNASTPSYATAESAQSRPNTVITPNAWQQQQYQALQNMTGSSSALYEGVITILGDPHFLIERDGDTTGAVQGGVLANGSAAAIAGDVLIIINFYNPIDLNYKTGLMDISPVPFSGIFRVWQVTSSFKSGVFKQVLHFTRMPAEPDIIANSRSPIKEVTNPSKAKLQDAAPPTVNPKTNATGVSVLESENTVPIPASITAPKYAGFEPATPGAPKNPITAATMSFDEIKKLSANLQATLANPLAGLQAEVASAQASLQGAIAGAAISLTGAITNPINELKSNVNSVQVAANATVNQIKSPLSSIMRT
jgi:hypothetical protein